MTYTLPPEPDAMGFFFPFLTYSFNFSALSKYCKHFALMLSLDLSPWASSINQKQDLGLASTFHAKLCIITVRFFFTFKPKLPKTNTKSNIIQRLASPS